MTQIVVLGMHESGAEEVACLINSMVACEGQAALIRRWVARASPLAPGGNRTSCA